MNLDDAILSREAALHLVHRVTMRGVRLRVRVGAVVADGVLQHEAKGIELPGGSRPREASSGYSQRLARPQPAEAPLRVPLRRRGRRVLAYPGRLFTLSFFSHDGIDPRAK